MDVQRFLADATDEDINDKLAELAANSDPSSMRILRQFLLHRDNSLFGKHTTPRLVSMALLQKGRKGVRTLANVLPEAPLSIYPTCIFEALWYAAKGQFQTKFSVQPKPPLSNPLTSETVEEARNVVYDLALESKSDPELFRLILEFVYGDLMMTKDLEAGKVDELFDLLFTGAIKVSRPLIEGFKTLIDKNLSEEHYQAFLKEHPVFLDPLASEVIPKQKLGLEFVTDFVVRRYDNKYILVEIEKPQDALFTSATDFTANFTHAFGQVLDFQQWVDSHGEYARSLLPGISSPRGLLVIGRRSSIDEHGRRKLARFAANSATIDVATFDDLVAGASNLYSNIYRKSSWSLS